MRTVVGQRSEKIIVEEHTCPRSFSFNKVLSIDVFYVHFSQLRVPILNMVCAGTNYHITQRLPIPDRCPVERPLLK